jgi:O-antigen ligase
VARLLFGDKLYGVLAVPTIAPFGPFVSKNHFAGYVEMAALVAVGLAAGLADEARQGSGRLSWIGNPRAGRVVLTWGVAAALILTVPVSLSRGGMVSLAAGMIAFAAIRVSTRWSHGARFPGVALALASLAVAGIGLALVLPPEARTRAHTLAGITGDISGAYRIGIWRDSLRLAAANPPVGAGFGAYEDAIPRVKIVAGDLRVEHAENDWVELLAEGGATAGILLALVVVFVISRGLRSIREEAHRLSRGIRAGALAGVIALLVHSACDFNLRIPSNALLFSVLLAFLLGPTTEREGAAADPPSAGRRGARVVLPLTAIAAVLAFVTPWTEERLSTTPLMRASRAPAAGLRWRALEDDVAAHLRHRPADASAWVILGWLRLPASRAQALPLVSWGLSLDPRREALRRVAERVSGAPPIQPPNP